MNTITAERSAEAAKTAARFPGTSEYFCVTMFNAGYDCRENFILHGIGRKSGCFDIDICFLEGFKKGLLVNPEDYGEIEKIGKACFVAGVEFYDQTHIELHRTTQK